MEKTTPLKAIREKCLNCCCYQVKEVELCSMTNCALYPFRMGKNPFASGQSANISDERRKALSEWMKRYNDEKHRGNKDKLADEQLNG